MSRETVLGAVGLDLTFTIVKMWGPNKQLKLKLNKLTPKEFYTQEIQNSQTQQYVKNLKASSETSVQRFVLVLKKN